MEPSLIALDIPEAVLAEMLRDVRVHGAFALAHRDVMMRRGFRALRARGYTVDQAIEVLEDQFYLSPPRIRAIVLPALRRRIGWRSQTA